LTILDNLRQRCTFALLFRAFTNTLRQNNLTHNDIPFQQCRMIRQS
jgi:hypothetical protein